MRISRLVATGLGLGHLPGAPGTWGSAGAALIFFPLSPFLSTGAEALVGAALVAAGVWASGRVARETGRRDPQEVVIDEIAGQWLALVGEGSPAGVLWRFALFRLLDIFKPPPVRQAEGLPGGLGIMADDVVAGLLANLIFLLGRHLAGVFAGLT